MYRGMIIERIITINKAHIDEIVASGDFCANSYIELKTDLETFIFGV